MSLTRSPYRGWSWGGGLPQHEAERRAQADANSTRPLRPVLSPHSPAPTVPSHFVAAHLPALSASRTAPVPHCPPLPRKSLPAADGRIAWSTRPIRPVNHRSTTGQPPVSSPHQHHASLASPPHEPRHALLATTHISASSPHCRTSTAPRDRPNPRLSPCSPSLSPCSPSLSPGSPNLSPNHAPQTMLPTRTPLCSGRPV